jgi:hypothetical protein
MAYELDLDELPGRYSQHYLQEWGPAESGARLKKIADKLASECRTRRDAKKDFSVAISHWENDLGWLKETFYNPLTYGFKWPTTSRS